MDRLKVYNNEVETIDEVKDLVEELNKELNEEICQVTNIKPIDLFEKEKEYLIPITNNSILDEYESLITRSVLNDSTIVYNKRKYSVPINFIGKEVVITIDKNGKDEFLSIYYNKKFINCHKIIDFDFAFVGKLLTKITHSYFLHILQYLNLKYHNILKILSVSFHQTYSYLL